MTDRPLNTNAAPLVIRLFGEVEVAVRGTAWQLAEKRPRVAWLLGLLALRHDGGVARSVVESLFWPESRYRAAQKNLRNLLRLLRDGLGEEAWRVSSPTRATLALDLSGAEADVVAFDRAIRRGDPISLERAVAVYRGSLLPACPDEWVEDEREQREEGFLRALETLATHALASGDATSALGYLDRAVSVDPDRESAQRLRMEVLAAQGDRTAAMTTYGELRSRLLKELGVEPQPETTALFQRIRMETRRRAQAPRGESATCPGIAVDRYEARFQVEMVGREEDARVLRERIADQRLVTVVGVGGVGKSCLADRVAQGLVSESKALAGAFVELHTVTDESLVAEAACRRLELEVAPDRSAVEALATFLRPQPFLLVLDNCEHVRAAAATLADALLRKCPQLRLLTTSRERLGLHDEQVYTLAPLPCPGAGGEMVGWWADDGTSSSQHPATSPPHHPPREYPTRFPSVRLFLLRAGLADPPLDENTLRAAGEICCRLDGIPLAIELAAARVRSGSLRVADVADALCQRWDVLAEGSPAAPLRHHTLEATIGWSWDLLNEAERRLLRQLAVFVGGWTLDAVETVASRAVVPVLLNLVEKSLVVAEERSGRTRYRLLETIRHFAGEKLRSAGEGAEARRCHARAFLELAERVGPEIYGPDQRRGLDRLEADHGNLLAALDESLAGGDAQLGLTLAAAIQGFWIVRGHIGLSRRYLRALLARPEAQRATTARAGALHALAVAEGVHGNQPESYRLFREYLALCRELGDRRQVSRALGRVAHTALSFMELDEAERLLQEGLAIARRLDDLPALALLFLAQGRMAVMRGDFDVANKHYEEALGVQRRMGHWRDMAGSLLCLGDVAVHRGEYGQARDYFNEAATMQRELADWSGLVSSLNNLAVLALEQGDVARARTLVEETSAMARKQCDPEPGQLSLLAEVALCEGDLAQARSLYEECAAICRERGDSRGLSRPLFGLAMHALYRHSFDKAIALCEESLALTESVDNTRSLAHVRTVLGRAWTGRGDLNQAQTHLRDGLRLHRQTECWAGACEALDSYAEVALGFGEPQLAARLLGAVAAHRDGLGILIYPVEQPGHDARLRAVRAALGEDGFNAAWEQGRALPVSDATALALGEAEATPPGDGS